MALGDVVNEVHAERYQARRTADYLPGPIRLPAEVWDRLDRLAVEFGWSRNRVMVELLDNGTLDIAAMYCRDDSGNLDAECFQRLAGE